MVLSPLLQWASELPSPPPDVLARARLQHLSTAAALRDTPGALAGAAHVGNGPAFAALTRDFSDGFVDFSAVGHLAAGPVIGAWAAASSWQEALRITVAANEVSHRLALYAALQGQPGPRRHWLEAVGAACALALGRSAPLEEVVPRALGPCTSSAHAAAVAWDAIEGAGEIDRLETGWAPLPHALGGLGSVWLTRSITYALTPAPAWAQTAVQGYQEIMRRHLKAAGRRLRPDQVERIVVRMHHVAHRHARGSAFLARRIAELTVAAPVDLGPIPADELLGHDDAIEAVARRVDVVPDWTQTVQWAARQAEVFGPLLAGLSRPTAARLLARAAAHLSPAETPPWGDLAQALKLVPGGLLALLPDRPGPVEPAVLSRPVHVRLHTIRGGWWAERREVVEGGPEYALDQLEADVLAKFAGGDPARAAAARVLAAPTDMPMVDALGLLA